ADLLVRQVTARVRWRESLLAMAPLGIGGTVELGAGRVLTGLARRTLEGVAAEALGTPAEIDAWLAAFEG
ncbi:MAG: ACP S-malonyltransferase, partial [Geminicoccaceae bacterium]